MKLFDQVSYQLSAISYQLSEKSEGIGFLVLIEVWAFRSAIDLFALQVFLAIR